MIEQLTQITAQSRDKKIGLLGGSFNPAHIGHIHLSLQAKKRLNLDEIWWLITPQNPLKPRDESKSQQARIAHIETLNLPTFIKLATFEKQLKSTNSYFVLQEIKKRGSKGKFVWLMGADNLTQISQWKNWQQIFETMPICIFDRCDNGYANMNCTAASKFKNHQIFDGIENLVYMNAPAWAFIKMPKLDISSTQIRNAVTNEL